MKTPTSNFAKAPEGWTLSNEAIDELTSDDKPLLSENFCCSILNSNGVPIATETIEAGSYTKALFKCIALAQDRNASSGSVSRGACEGGN